jgi:4-amino-4-deoxy-L-arabinose transferase-like glycosyltransferase
LKRIRGLAAAPGSSPIWEIAIVVVIVLAATFFRTFLFEAAPPGLQHDEIFKANFALDVLDGGWPVFFDPNGGNEALFPYLAAMSISLFGHNFFALRFVSLVCGILSVVLSYALMKELFGRRVALLTAGGLAISFWHIFDSRIALRAITLLLMALASFHLFWLGLKRGKIVWFALAGVSLGVTFYTYTSGYLVLVTLVLFTLLYLLPFHRTLLTQRWQGILLAIVISLIILLPMGYHLYTHPATSTARARDLGDHINLLLAGDPGPILGDVLSVLGMFGLRGDPEWRYNLAGRPVFDPVTFLLFCVGLLICLIRIGKLEYAFLLVWLGVNLVPSAVTRNSPSTLRAIGSLTAIYALPALTIDLAWDWVARRFGSLGRRALLVAVALLFLSNAAFTLRDYFTVWAENSEVSDIYRADLSAVARYLEQSVGDEVICMSASFAADLDQQILNYMLGEQRAIRWFNGQQALVFPQSSSRVLYIFPATGPLGEDLAARFFADPQMEDPYLDPRGEPLFVAYRLSQGEVHRLREVEPEHPLAVQLGDRAELLGYDLPSTLEAGSQVRLLLYWRVSQPIRPDLLYAFFAHVVDTRQYVWAQSDTLGYPVSSWIEGDVVVQAFDLGIPSDAPPLEYEVKMGMYDLVTGVRLEPSAGGVPLPGRAVTSGPFSVMKAARPPSIEELEIPRERYANFDEKVMLLGCDLEPVHASAGDAVHISLYWQALAEPTEDYLVSVLMTDEAGNELFEVLRTPVDGEYPTSLWSAGQVVRDRFGLIVDPSIPVGRHRLWARLYDPSTQAYLTLTDSEEDRVRVGKVWVLSESEG